MSEEKKCDSKCWNSPFGCLVLMLAFFFFCIIYKPTVELGQSLVILIFGLDL